MSWVAGMRRLDWLVLTSLVVLLGLGLIVLLAINFKDPRLELEFKPLRQVIYAGIGLGLMVLFTRIDYRLWLRFGSYWYLLGLGLLGGVLVIGKTAQGATRAIDLGLLQFQPTELAKLGLIMVLAGLFARNQRAQGTWRFLWLSFFLMLLPAGLIAIQPDLGSAIVVAGIWLVLILVSGTNKRQVAILLLLGLVLAPIVINNLAPYQRQRLYSFIDPEADPRGAGYNVLQSTIAVGSGHLLGKGLGSGTQSQLNFLPSQHTDFIFAVLAEKLGFLGAGLVLLAFGTLLVRGLLIAKRAGDYFGMMLGMGIVGFLLFHIVINIGMNLGIMPVTGIPLPFLSYGGTNLIICLVAIGILQSIAVHRPDLEFRP